MSDKIRPDYGLKKPNKICLTHSPALIDRISILFHDCPDFVVKKILLSDGRTGYCLFLETLANPETVQDNFINPLLAMNLAVTSLTKLSQNLPIGTLINNPDEEVIVNTIASGSVLFMLEGEEPVLAVRLKPPFRNVPEPESEKVINGPHEGFSADLHANLTLIRSKLLSNQLKFKLLDVGRLSPKKIAIAYYEGVTQPQLLDRLIKKIEGLELDKLTGSGQLEALIKDFPLSPFPQFQATERPDQAIDNLLAGKLLIFLDGTPVTLSAPTTFFTFFQKPDDLNGNWLFRPFIRLLRLLAMGLALFLPALYVAIMSYHFYIIPVNFLIPLAESRARVPFPPIIETLFLETIIELLRESTSRLASHLGATIGIMAGVLLGVAALSTGVISGSLIIVSMVTLIASLVVPTHDLSLSTRILKFTAMFLAAVFGVLGLVVTAAVTFAHLITLESLGQPYFQPFIPFKLGKNRQKKGQQ